MMTRQKSGEISCYLTAPAKADTDALRLVFQDLGVRIDPTDELPPAGEILPGRLRRRLREVNFVCAVLPEGASERNVLFELGVAAGVGRPIFIVAERAGAIPFALRAYPYVEARVEDAQAIRFHLEIFLQNLSSSTRAAHSKPPPPGGSTKLRPDTAADLRQRSTSPHTSGLELTRTVADALIGLGAHVAMEPAVGDERARPDIVAWLPKASRDLGTPFVIEVERRLYDREIIINRIERYLSATGARTALLIFQSAGPFLPEIVPDIDVRIVSSGYVFLLSLDVLLNLAQQGSLFARLTEARNRFVHSVR